MRNQQGGDATGILLVPGVVTLTHAPKQMWSQSFVSTLLLFYLFLPASAWGQNVDWDPSGGASPFDWNNTSNWRGNNQPDHMRIGEISGFLGVGPSSGNECSAKWSLGLG